MSNDPDLWKEWAAKAQSGDQNAYRHLLTTISPFIRSVLLGSLSNPDAADDITQEVLISVHKSLPTYAADRPFKPWLRAIINFRRTDYLRKHYARREDKKSSLDCGEFLKTHVTNPVHAGEYKDIERELSALPDKQKDIFTQVKIEGYTAKEVAEKMNMSASAVKVSAHRTMVKLKDKLG